MKTVYLLRGIGTDSLFNERIIIKNIACYGSEKSVDNAKKQICADIKARDYINDYVDYYFYEEGVKLSPEQAWNKLYPNRDFSIYEKYENMFKYYKFSKLVVEEVEFID